MNKNVIAIIATCFTLSLVLGVLGTGLYQVRYKQSESPAILTMARVLGFDAASVGSGTVRYQDYLVHKQSLEHFLKSPLAIAEGGSGQFTSTDASMALDRAIRIEAVSQFARAEHIVLPQTRIDGAFLELLQKQSSSTNVDEASIAIEAQLGWTLDQFKQYIITPALQEEALKQVYASREPTESFDDVLEQFLKDEVKVYIVFP